MKLDRECRRLLIYSRLGTLSQLYFFDRDGVQYIDLKTETGLKDSFLGPQLKWLEDKRYIRRKEESMDDKKEAVYYITDKGREKYKTVLDWLLSLPAIKTGIDTKAT